MAGETKNEGGAYRAGLLFLGMLACLLAVVWLWMAWAKPPQMGSDPDVFKTVDALYTAVRNQDQAQIGACEKTLGLLCQEGKLPLAAHQHLVEIVRLAKADQGQASARALYRFMLDQHR